MPPSCGGDSREMLSLSSSVLVVGGWPGASVCRSTTDSKPDLGWGPDRPFLPQGLCVCCLFCLKCPLLQRAPVHPGSLRSALPAVPSEPLRTLPTLELCGSWTCLPTILGVARGVWVQGPHLAAPGSSSSAGSGHASCLQAPKPPLLSCFQQPPPPPHRPRIPFGTVGSCCLMALLSLPGPSPWPW